MTVYLDVASAAPWHPAARSAHARFAAERPGDPARAHASGRAARDLLEQARAAVATTIGAAPERLLFTSGGTEAAHLAVRGAAAVNRQRPARILSTAVEHSCVHAAADATGLAHEYVRVDGEGRLDLEALAAALEGGALLVDVQHANHEVGTLQPVAEAARLAHQAGALVLIDACQTVGRLPVDLATLGADFLSLSAAKFGGGRGVGALAWSPAARFGPLLSGDEREGRRRSGLQDVAGIAAMAETLLHLAPSDPSGEAASEAVRADGLRRRLREALSVAVGDLAVHGPQEGALPHVVAVSALYCEGQALVDGLDARGFEVHSGSSCASTAGEPSHVLVAMGALTHGHVRVSFGPDVGEADLGAFVEAFTAVVAELRAGR